MRHSASASAEASSDAIFGQNELSPAVNAISVCRICGELCIIYSDSWSFTLTRSNLTSSLQKWRRPTDVKSFKYKINEKNWQHYELYQQIVNHLRNSNFETPFPICNSCASTVLQRIKSRIQFLNTSQQLFLRLDIGDKSVFSKTLHQEIDSIKTETDAFKDASNESEKQAKRINLEGLKGNRSSEFIGYIRSIESLEKEDAEERDGKLVKIVQSPSMESTSDSQRDEDSTYKTTQQQEQFSSLTLSVVFHISYDKHFGTINYMRLGQTAARTVPYDEINSGFVVFLHLITNICRLANFDYSSLKFGVTCSINDIELNANDMNSRRGVAHFNKAIHELFAFCEQLFIIIKNITNKNLVPPFTIKSDEKKIEKENYNLEYNDPSKWTTAMKYLLADFKFIQCQTMKTSIRLLPF